MVKLGILARARLLFGLLGGLALLMGVGSAYVAGQVKGSLDEIVVHQDRVQQLALEFKINVIQIQQWLTDVSATRGLNGLNDGFDQAQTYYGQAQANIKQLTDVQHDPRLTPTDLNAARGVLRNREAHGPDLCRAGARTG